MMILSPDRAATETECSDPARLIELLYQGALRDLKEAAELGSDLAHAADGTQLVTHAQAILKELQASLNYTQGGYLAINLGRVYEYMYLRLQEVIARQADDPQRRVREVIGLLEALSDAWSTMANTQADGPNASTLVREGVLVA